jgi:hypothetical protein
MARKAVQGYTEKTYYDNTRFLGMLATLDTLNEGYFRHLVNVDISDTGQSLKPRDGFITTTVHVEDAISANPIFTSWTTPVNTNTFLSTDRHLGFINGAYSVIEGTFHTSLEFEVEQQVDDSSPFYTMSDVYRPFLGVSVSLVFNNPDVSTRYNSGAGTYTLYQLKNEYGQYNNKGIGNNGTTGIHPRMVLTVTIAPHISICRIGLDIHSTGWSTLFELVDTDDNTIQEINFSSDRITHVDIPACETEKTYILRDKVLVNRCLIDGIYIKFIGA